MSQSVPFFVFHKTVTVQLQIRVRGHFVMSITKHHESNYVSVLDNPQEVVATQVTKSMILSSKLQPTEFLTIFFPQFL